MMLYQLPLQLLAAASCVLASPLNLTSRDGSLQTLPQSIPEGIDGELYLQYKPFIRVVADCIPYPAVDAQGHTNDGTDSKDVKDCNYSEGQVYVRAEPNYEGLYAIMYTWYFKRRTSETMLGHKINHPHDWQQVVIFLSPLSRKLGDYEPTSIAYSVPFGYWKRPMAKGDRGRPHVSYEWRDGNRHAMAPSKEDGMDLNLIAWEQFTQEAKNAINSESSFGGWVAPFADSRFYGHLKAAYDGLGDDQMDSLWTTYREYKEKKSVGESIKDFFVGVYHGIKWGIKAAEILGFGL